MMSAAKCHSGRTAFLEQILPGLAGGLAASITFYPLELYETTVQAGSRPKQDSCHPQTSRRRRATVIGEKLQENQHGKLSNPVWGQNGRPNLDSRNVAAVFRGVDMAMGSALFGFGAFFSTFAIVDAIAPGSSLQALVAKNIVAAFVSQFVNSPFQLLKTSIVLSNISARRAFLNITRDGRELQRLWTGVQANLLGVTLVASQFTFFKLLVNQFGGNAIGPVEAGLIGAIASLGACLLTYPSVALKTKVMADDKAASSGNDMTANNGSDDECCLVRAAHDMWVSRSLYTGLTPFLLRSVPPTGMLFAIQRFFESSY